MTITRTLAARAFLLAALTLPACGDSTDTTSSAGQDDDGGTPTADVPAIEDVEWALGWWRDPAENTNDQDGLILFQVELREDGTAVQDFLFCKTPDERYVGRWEPASDDVVHLLPAEGDETMTWLSSGSWKRVELRRVDGETRVEVARISTQDDDAPNPSAELISGRKCMTDIVVSDCTTRNCDAGE